MSDITEALTHAVTDACTRHPSSAAPAQEEGWNRGLWTALRRWSDVRRVS